MGYFKFLNKIFPASPDAILKKAPESQAVSAKLAHINHVINDLSDVSFYTLELDQQVVFYINSNKGIIEILNLSGALPNPGAVDYTLITLTCCS